LARSKVACVVCTPKIARESLALEENEGIVFTAVRSGSNFRLVEKKLALPSFLQTIEQTGLSTWMRETESPFGFYFVLLFHTFGLALLVGANAVVDLRLLGVGRDIPLAPLKRLFALMWTGFWINAASGTLLVIAYPTKSLTNPDFYIKLTLIGFAVWTMHKLQSHVFDDSSLGEAAIMAKGATLAKWSLLLWVGAITAGRLLAYTYTHLTFP
jgi:hypothetical protein